MSFSVIDQAASASRVALAGQAPLTGLPPQLSLYPNPSRDNRFSVQLAQEVRGKVSYTLVSSWGRKVAAGTITRTRTGRLLGFNFSGQFLPAGIYYLKLEGAELKKVLQVIREQKRCVC